MDNTLELPVQDESTLEKAQRMSRNIIFGRKTKYEPEFHIPILLEHFLNGRDISAFCYSSEVCEKTFFNWLDKYPQFKVAYSIAKRLAQMWWEEMALQNVVNHSGVSNFNQTLWSMVMRNRFSYTEHRKLSVPKLKNSKSVKEQIEALVSYLSDGNLTAPEANQVSNLVLAYMRVEEHTEVKKEIAEFKRLMNK